MIAGLTTGCLGPRRDNYQSSQPVMIAVSSPEADGLWAAVQDTLRTHRFRLDRVDRRAGIITTLPETSQHFFEVWRHDVDTRTDFWEATLNPLRRWVEVTLAGGDDSTWTKLAVAVHKERFSAPDRQFNSSGSVYEYFGDELPSTGGSARLTLEDDLWYDQGRDPAMEEYLLDLILERAGLDAGPDLPAISG